MSKLFVSLFFAACIFVVFTSGSSISRRFEDTSSMRSEQYDGEKAMSTLDKHEDESDEHEKDTLVTRFIDGLKNKVNTAQEYWNEAQGVGDASQELKVSSDQSSRSDESAYGQQKTLETRFLDGLKTSVTNAGDKAKEYMNKAQEKVNEVKDKAKSLPDVDLSKIELPEIGKRNMDSLKHVMKSYMGSLSLNENDIFNFLSKRQDYRNPAQESDAMKFEDDSASNE